MTYISRDYATLLATPESFITRGKKRLKQHIDTVYLNNGDEFEIELFNPTKNKLLSKIEINGKSIGSGIILRPGERIFLERYLDEAKKFLFETYVVNGNNKEVQEAIENNGDVTISFHEEILPLSGGYTTNSGTVTYNNPLVTPFTYTTHNFNPTITTSGTYFNTNSTTLTSGISTNTYFNKYEDGKKFTKSATSPLRHIETGRVEKGSDSNQTFTYDNTSFKSYASWANWWKIKPQSTKLVVKEDLITYCTECGAKRKKDTHKFCPHCGTKF